MKAAAEIICIGTELTTGRVVNTNAALIARHLNALGLRVARQTAVADDVPAMLSALREAAKRSSLLFLTGGLGPTADDLTTQVIAQLVKKPLVRSHEATQRLRIFLRERKRSITPADLKMCQVPQGAHVFRNANGMACGYGVKIGKALGIVAPGVPAELLLMLEQEITPFLKKHFHVKQNFAGRVARIYGMAEAQVDREVSRLDLAQHFPEITVGFTLAFPEILIWLDCYSEKSPTTLKGRLDELEALLRRHFAKAFIGVGEQGMATAIHDLLLRKRLTLAVAESCTGGGLAKTLTEQSGSSSYFLGGVISYANESKVRDLSVPNDVLMAHGAVSAPCAEAMSKGVRRRFGSAVGLSVTGVAGPDGGTAEKPVGTVFVGLDFRGEMKTERFAFSGDRERIRHLAQFAALNLLRERLLSFELTTHGSGGTGRDRGFGSP